MNSPNEPADTPENAATTTSHRIGRVPGSKNSAMQDRAVRTREAIVAVAARHFDTDGYGNTSINTISATGKFAKGAMYYHFPSKEAIAEHLISDWNRTLDDTVSEALASGSSSTAGEKLTAIFTSLSRQIAEDTNVRAGMKLTLEPTIDNAAGFAHWVDAISDIIETAITDGELTNTPTTRRLAWNLCAGTIGAVNASVVMCEDIDLSTRIEGIVAAHLHGTLA
ncbi:MULTISPECIES: TetR/AcrR family transcriptional regulator [Rhodococcus erythropolis group]|uniref:TetR/AcrR family transcriptional regulator n=1 Tax=Rhodococcus qingshengii TaxID=334542 RepID=A0A2A5J2P8_RHOSG|nr:MULTISPECIES: TetR/AcrR family transcriptional regulator [Rhodococcus erythropolis group]MBO8150656.1 TetR/AcrR family transcriptional regulator [Rhodococcus erythropolis]MDO1492946.1 TetR/AcrR family transcriptional regulator [Rhodococcus erythropolis]PCK23865.1 TetR/AcrR family transcriptional regulator [Rhodococcus qingshengii]